MALPNAYKQVEYIESTGTQYIDTGFKPNQDTRIICELGGAPRTTEQHLFGARTSTGSSDRFLFLAAGNSESYRSDYYDNNVSISTSFDFSSRFTVDKNKNQTFLNGTLAATNNSGNFSTAYNVFLLASNTSGTPSIAKSGARLYSAKIYDNGTLVRDFIPCQTTSGEIGLWDDANSVFYGNAGTGTFVAGPVMVQPETPAALNVLGATQNAVILVWAAAPVEQSYRLYRDGAVIYDGTDLSYTDHGLAAGSTHTYTVTGVVGTVETDGVTAEAATASGIVLITDRTEADVSSGRTKGRYNALDLIRVGEAVLYTKSILNSDTGFDINVSVKLDWQMNEIPTQAQMHAYLENIRRVRSIVQAYRTTADAPSSMNGLTWGKANDIEAILSDAETLVRDIMRSNHCYSGRTISGVLALP